MNFKTMKRLGALVEHCQKASNDQMSRVGYWFRVEMLVLLVLTLTVGTVAHLGETTWWCALLFDASIGGMCYASARYYVHKKQAEEFLQLAALIAATLMDDRHIKDAKIRADVHDILNAHFEPENK